MKPPVKRQAGKMPEACPLRAKVIDEIVAKLEAEERAAKEKQAAK